MATVRVPFIGNPSNRTTSVNYDQRFVNCFPDIVKTAVLGENTPDQNVQNTFIVKRDGTSYHSRPPGANAEGRGLTSWNGKLYSVIGDKLYSNTTAIKTLATSTGAVGFTSFSAANDYLILLDGTDGYYISTTDTVTEITDAEFPTPHLPYPVFLDGYLFVQKTTGEIFNCDAGDVTSWASTSYIQPESYPDGGVALYRLNNLLVAVGVNSIEFFYNAAAAAPGSPLGRNLQALIQFGTASGTSIAQEEGKLVFVAVSKTGEKFVVSIEGTTPTVISNAAINKLLTGEASNIIDSWGYLVRQKGHLFYVLNLSSQSRTIVFDFITRMWHEWEWYDGASDSLFPMVSVTEFEDEVYLLHQANGKIYKFSPTVYQDDSNHIKFLLQTDKYDFGSAKVKFADRIEFLGDWYASSLSMSVYWSDDDYKTWTSARSIDLTSRAYLYRCGAFRRRAFKLYSTANAPIRLNSMELELRGGVH